MSPLKETTRVSDTPTSLDPNCADAHYPANVTTQRRRRNVELTPAQQQSIARVRAVAKDVMDAQKALDAALAERARVVRTEWNAHLSPLRATRIAREVGEDLIGEATVRGLTADLRAAERAND